MPLYRLAGDHLAPVAPITFADARLSERHDLQRLLRDQIGVLDPDLLVIAEEFASWEDSARRIDLLAVDRAAKLVVIELKVTEDGGHADLQALRYAAMVSAMTFDQAVDAFASYLALRGRPDDARRALLSHVGWTTPEDGRFAADVRLVLVSAGFSREITTTVLWLRDRGLDVRCVRVRPHRLSSAGGEGILLADVEQLIPLREAEEFQVRLVRKAQEERAAVRERPSVEQMRQRVEAGRSSAERTAIDTIIRHVESLGGRWFANAASLAVSMRDAQGTRYHPMSFRPDREGCLEVWFRWLASQGVLADPALRRALLDRLNAVPGIALPPDRIDRMPTIPLTVLAADPVALQRFCDVWDWFAEALHGPDAVADPVLAPLRRS